MEESSGTMKKTAAFIYIAGVWIHAFRFFFRNTDDMSLWSFPIYVVEGFFRGVVWPIWLFMGSF